MRLIIVAVGRLKAGPERDLVARYIKRAEAAGRALGMSGPDIVEIAEGREGRAEDRRRGEGARIIGRLSPDAAVVLLDERGREEESVAFAERLRGAADTGAKELAFVIGGADGHADEIRSRAAAAISFGRATWPHQLVRIMLAEQIYRAMTILSGHPYHRA